MNGDRMQLNNDVHTFKSNGNVTRNLIKFEYILYNDMKHELHRAMRCEIWDSKSSQHLTLNQILCKKLLLFITVPNQIDVHMTTLKIVWLENLIKYRPE